jgi:hypothetical protein
MQERGRLLHGAFKLGTRVASVFVSAACEMSYGTLSIGRMSCVGDGLSAPGAALNEPTRRLLLCATQGVVSIAGAVSGL